VSSVKGGVAPSAFTIRKVSFDLVGFFGENVDLGLKIFREPLWFATSLDLRLPLSHEREKVRFPTVSCDRSGMLSSLAVAPRTQSVTEAADPKGND